MFCYKINSLLTENGENLISAQPRISAHLEYAPTSNKRPPPISAHPKSTLYRGVHIAIQGFTGEYKGEHSNTGVYRSRSVQNADCRPGTKCRLGIGTKCRLSINR